MGEEQRDCTLYIAPLVHEMYVQRFESVNLYSSLEIGQLVELCFLLSPIESLPPIGAQSFHVSQRSAIIPSGLVKLIGEGCGFKFLDKPLALFLGDGNGEGFNCCHDTIEDKKQITAGAEEYERELIMSEEPLQNIALLIMRSGHYRININTYMYACPSPSFQPVSGDV